MRLRGAAVIHGPKLDDDILAKALDQLTAERHCQEKHPFARRHFCPLFSGLIILLFASLARSPLPLGRTRWTDDHRLLFHSGHNSD